MLGNNTWITDLRVGYYVIEYHKSSGYQYISKVVSIDEYKIGVERSDGTIHYYSIDGEMIMYKYGTKIPDFYLQQYEYPTEGTPRDPTPLSSMTKVDSIDSNNGNNYDTYTDLTIKEGMYQ